MDFGIIIGTQGNLDSFSKKNFQEKIQKTLKRKFRKL
jgi:hypothetical protein